MSAPFSRARLALLIGLAATSACRSRTPAAPTAPPATQAAAAPGAPAAPSIADPPDRPPPPPIPEADVRALVTAWTDAQNHGDFNAYSALYAARFEGVRRSGPRTRRFARAGWLADRQAMFHGAQHVETSNVRVESSSSLARVAFTQTFAAGTFHDQGPKQLVVVREGGALRIAREEMLRSTVTPAATADGGTPAAPAVAAVTAVTDGGASGPPADFMLTLTVYQTLGVVLDTDPEDAWGTGAPRLVHGRDEETTARRAVDPTRLPPALAAMRGRRVRLYGPAGATCTATVGEPALIHRVDVHFGTQQRWDGQADEPRASDAQVARESWDMGGGGLVLFAPVTPEAGGACGDARWARAVELPEPVVFARGSAPAALAAQAVARFRALPAYRAIQDAYAQDPGATRGAQWVAQPEVTLWQHATSGRRFLTVTAREALGGCADFSGALWTVFEVTGTNTLVPRTDAQDPGAFEPSAALDADGDGEIDFVVGDGLIEPNGGGHYGVTRSIAVPNLDCNC